MSDNKKIRNRLNQIFADIAEPDNKEKAPGKPRASRKSPAKETKSPLKTVSEPPRKPSLHTGRLSLPEESPAATVVTVTEAGGEGVSTLSVPFNMGDSWSAIEIIDEKERRWNTEEQALVRDVVDQLTLALQNARLFQQTQKQNSNLEILNEMGRTLATQLNIQEVIESAYKFTSQLLNTDSFFVALFNSETETLSFPLVTVGGKRISYPDRKTGQGLTDYVLRTRKPVLLNGDVTAQMEQLGITFIPLGNTRPAVSWLGVPLAIGNRTLGAIVVQSTETPYLYTEQERDLLIAVASQTAIALQNAQLFQQIEAQNAELAVLNKMSNELSTLQNVEGVTDIVYKYTGALMDTTDFFIALYHKETNEISFPAVYFGNKKVHIDRQEVGNGLTGYIIKTREPLFFPDQVEERSRALGLEIINIVDEKPALCWLGVPMTLGTDVLGVIALQSETTAHLYTERHRDLLVAIASQAAIAIQNANLYQSIQISETRFRDVALASADWVWEIDLAGRYTYCSDKVFDVLGYRPEEMYGKSPTDFMPSYEAERVAPLMNKIITSQERMIDFENRNQTRNGREIILVTNGLPILNENGEMVGYRGVNKDVTAQRLDEVVDEVIAEITEAGVADESLDKVLPDIHKSILRLVPARNLYFALYDREQNIISYPYKVDEKDPEPWEAHEPSNNLTHYVIRHANPVFFTSSEEIDRLSDTGEIKRYGSPARQWIGIPLRTKEVIGMFAIQSYDESLELTNEHFEVLKRFAPQIATVVEKIRAEESLSKSEAELRALFNSMNDVIVVYNSEGRYVRIAPTNPSRLLMPANELLGKTIYDVLPPDLQKIFMDAIQRALRTSETIQIEYPLNIGGQKFWFDASVSKLSSDQVFWVARDITERKIAEEALRRQNEYLATATEVGRLITSTLDLPTLFSRTANLLRSRFGYYHVSIFTVDESGFNAVLREGTGEAGEEMKRRQHSLAVGSKSIIGYVTANAKTLVVNNTAIDPMHRPNPLLPETRAEAAIPLKIGSRVIGAVDIQAREVGAFKDEDIAVLETLADQIAVALDNARSYELAQQAVNEMRELDRIKSQFLANMSHELRTPLNSIIGFSRVILKGIDGPINEQQHQDLSAIYNSGQHLLNLINDVLDLSKIEAGKMELALEELNVIDTINSVMSTAIGLVKDKPVRLEKEIAPNLPTVRGDSMRIRQVLLNLMANAAKFTEEGTITVEARPHTSSTGVQEVLISVRDTGPGISPEDQTKLFQAFSQVDSSPTRKSGGTGLGLSICHRLVELHGGRIGVHSVVGEGSTFYFTIPVFHQEIDEASNGKVILCIDDDQQIINLYERYLKPQGYKVVPLMNPANARDTIRRLKPYAVTLDIMMPEIDGWQVLRDIKNDPEIRDVPVIICSIVEEEEKGFSLGAADYLVKPILQDDLLSSLNRLNGDGTIREVLIIDDSLDDLRLIERIISEKGAYHPVLAQGGNQGWEMINSRKPHAIILDLFMPDLDGFTILERLKTTPDLRDIPVVVISGADLNDEQQNRLAQLGKTMLQKGMLEQSELFGTLERDLRRLKAR